MSAPTPPDCWVPIDLPWRLVDDGELFVPAPGQLWVMLGAVATATGFAILAAPVGSQRVHTVPIEDPDELIPVLVAMTEHDVVTSTRGALAERVIAARTTDEGVAA